MTSAQLGAHLSFADLTNIGSVPSNRAVAHPMQWGSATTSRDADCPGANFYGFYLNDALLYCRTVLDQGGQVAAGGEAIINQPTYPFPILNITVHYRNFDKRTFDTGSWTNVGGGSSLCEAKLRHPIDRA